jgi:hypothetical protein
MKGIKTGKLGETANKETEIIVLRRYLRNNSSKGPGCT